MAEATKKKYSYSIKGVEIPDSEWLDLLQGAAYANMSYHRFTTMVKDGTMRSYEKQPGSRRRVVSKTDIDHYRRSHPAPA